MENGVIVHGKPPQERYERALVDPNEPMPHEANWLPWLGRELNDRDIEVSIPALPLPYFPVFEEWKAVFPEDKIGPETALIGHSAGAEFLLRWLSENKDVFIEHLVLVAPYHDYGDKYGDFSHYTIDRGLVERVGKLTILYSSDDDESIVRRAKELIDIFPEAEAHDFKTFGHFREGHNMNSVEFPELLKILGVE